MKRRIGIAQGATLRADLPGESLGGTPLLEVLGNNRVLIENHKGITCYSNDKISINTVCGGITVHGDAMEIICMSKPRLVITGDIHSVTFDGGK